MYFINMLSKQRITETQEDTLRMKRSHQLSPFALQKSQVTLHRTQT